MSTTSEKAKNATAEERRFMDEHDGLSDSTMRARWIHGRDEHEERPGETLATRDHEAIMAWAEARKARPATVPGSEHDGRPGVLRLDFPDYSESLQEIGWDDWFASFDERNLVFLYQEHTKDGNESNFFRLDNPDRERG